MQTLNQQTAGARRFNAVEYHRMAAAGILSEDERTELIDGVIYSMPPAGAPHSGIVNLIVKYLLSVLNGRLYDVRFEEALSIDEHNEPVPDVMIAAPDLANYTNVHPTPGDVQVVVEVADSSLSTDLNTKRKLYARVGIGEYWVVDVNARCLHRFTQPGLDGYGDERVLDAIAAIDFASTRLEIARFFPPA
ncbi:MAG: Uma2 family endonuclease [Aphanocapsa lilacina HA4352-LM1]|jgi:Uma2 family endonuclease|nr:Uma2 family endonuclease [Aphanocapsa lilacina HA4352-LM1]